MTRKITILAVVAMLAMGTSAALALSASPQSTNDAMAQETTTTGGGMTTTAAGTAMGNETTTANETASVTFDNQTSNGSSVVVSQVFVPNGGFVVIHAAEQVNATTGTAMGNETTMANETSMGNETTGTSTETAMSETGPQYQAGEVLGNSTYLEPGTHENVTVTLSQPINESQVLIAMPHRDTNDNQQDDFPEADAPYTTNGQPVTDWAYVTVEAAGNATTTAMGNETTAAGTETTTSGM